MKVLLHELEHIRDTYHQSVVVLLKPFAVSGIALIVIWYFAMQYGIVGRWKTIVLFLSIVMSIHAIRALAIWHLNSYIVTNKRLIKHSHEGLFQRTVIETPHERILNVSYKTTGFLSVMFRFGDVEVQVVGLVEPIILKHISNPAAIKDYLWQLHTRAATTQGIFEVADMTHVQERVGYTKKNQRIL